MASILLAIAAAVSWGVSDFLGGQFSRRLALASVLLITQAVGFTMLLVLALLQGPPAMEPGAVGFAVGASIGGLVGIAALYRGMAVGLVSVVAPISATGAAVPVIVGLLRGERATALQTAGIVLALIGIVLASISAGGAQATSSRPTVTRGVGLALLAAFGFGGFFVMLHEASVQSVLWAGVVMRLTGVCILLVIALALRAPVTVGWRRLPGLLVVGVLDTSANLLYGYASTLGLVSLAAVLASLFPVVTVILARVVLQERLTRAQGAGVALALTGVALIVLA